MIKVGHVIKAMSNADNSLGIASFINYLSHFETSSDPLEARHFNNFFAFALSTPHWNERREHLETLVRRPFENFLNTFHCDFEEKIYWPSDCQLLKISGEFITATEKYASHQTQSGDQQRIVPVDQNSALIVTKQISKEIKVQQVENLYTIRKGALRPLRENLIIQYNSDLTLKDNALHIFAVSPHLVAQLTGPRNGRLFRGYSFQPYLKCENQPLETNSNLFFPLKRIESHFINKDSDPFYSNLVSELERLCRLMRLGDQTAHAKAPRFLDRAQSIFRYVFPTDRVLGLLVNEAERLLQNTQLKDDLLCDLSDLTN